MPRRTAASATVISSESEMSPLLRNFAIAIIGLLCTLIGSGIVGMISLSIKVAAVAESAKSTSDSLARHLDNSVAKDDYVRRDRAVQDQLNRAATKDELRDLQHQLDLQQHQLDTQTDILKDLQALMSRGRGRY